MKKQILIVAMACSMPTLAQQIPPQQNTADCIRQKDNNNQAGVFSCLKNDLTTTNNTINERLLVLQKQHADDPAFLKALASSQQAWQRYRDAHDSLSSNSVQPDTYEASQPRDYFAVMMSAERIVTLIALANQTLVKPAQRDTVCIAPDPLTLVKMQWEGQTTDITETLSLAGSAYSPALGNLLLQDYACQFSYEGGMCGNNFHYFYDDGNGGMDYGFADHHFAETSRSKDTATVTMRFTASTTLASHESPPETGDKHKEYQTRIDLILDPVSGCWGVDNVTAWSGLSSQKDMLAYHCLPNTSTREEINQCAGVDLPHAEAELNRVNIAVQQCLANKPALQPLFTQSNQAWTAFMNAQLPLVPTGLQAQYKRDLIMNRAIDLKNFIKMHCTDSRN